MVYLNLLFPYSAQCHQDLSRNGIHINGHRVRKANIILMDGDVLVLPGSLGLWLFISLCQCPAHLTTSTSQAFTCMHICKEHGDKLTIFYPSPLLQPVQEVSNLWLMFVVDILFLTSVKRIGGYIVTSQCLGTGSFAKVHLAVDPTRHRQVACKSIRADREYDVRQVRKEVRILMALRHVSQQCYSNHSA